MLAAQRSLHPVLSCRLCTAPGNLSAQDCVPVPVYSVSRLYVVFTISFITFPHVPLTFLHVLDNPYRRIYLLPGPSGQPPATQDMSPGAHKSKTITSHYVLHTFLYVPRQPSFLEGDSWERSERDVSYYAQGHYHARVPVALSGS